MGTIDSSRCRKYYTQIMEKFKLNKRLNAELIEYASKKKAAHQMKSKKIYIMLPCSNQRKFTH
jgi:hypothetical protein